MAGAAVTDEPAAGPLLTRSGSSFEYQPPRTPTLASCRRPVVKVLVWGRGDLGQLGNGVATGSASPEVMASLPGKDVTHIAAGMFNTAYVTADGELYTAGDNELGQLGTRLVEGCLEPRRVAALEASTIVHVSVGLGHVVAVTEQGSLASWGSAEFGQLGQGSVGVSAHQPRIIRGTRELRFVQVACGACHTLALTASGQVYAFGQGTFGALGQGDDSNAETPSLVKRLWATGVVQVAAGENHSAALAADGRVFTWGRGKYGQLGLGDFSSQQSPVGVKAIAGIQIVQICCGGDHTLALTRRGEVFSWGRGTWGQTGLGSTDSTCLPRRLESLGGRRVQQLAAGSRHSMLLTVAGEILLFGNGEEGQMGLGGSRLPAAVVSPCPLPLPPIAAPPSPSPSSTAATQHLRPTFIAAGGDLSVMVFKQAAASSPFGSSQRNPIETPPAPGAFPMVLPNLLELAEAATTHNGTDAPASAVGAMTRAVEAVFTSPGILIAGFMRPVASDAAADDKGGAGELDHGLDSEAIKQVFTAILHTYNSEVVVALANACCTLLDSCEKASKTPDIAPQAEWLKALLIICQNPVMGDTRHGPSIVNRLAAVIASLSAPSQQMLSLWIGKMPREDFAVRLVRPVQKHISRLCSSASAMRQNRPEMLRIAALLDYIHDVNETAGGLISFEEFHNKEVSEYANLRDEYLLSVEQPPTRAPIRSLCQVPFIFTPEAKSRILQGEANLQKRHEVTNSSFHALLAGMHPGHFQWMHITVRRENLLEDALNEIIRRPQDLKKPLKVTFMSAGVVEEGLDEGGVAREFFMLLTRELLDVKYGMFVYLPETRTYWFNQASVEPDVNFKLVGILLGLAIYNSVILDVHLPLVVYKKLLDHQPTFDDLKVTMPELGRGLQQLLDFDGDVENVFMRNFDVEYEFYGEMRTVELLPGGSAIPVTSANRHKYVELYTKWVLTDSIARHFNAFAEGFHQVCDGPALRLFRHEELELLVCGLPHLDFEALEKVTRYDGGYTKSSPTIVMFWQVLHSLSLDHKKKFLLFTTGCDRAPVGGLGQLPLVIQRSGPDTSSLPTSHTCFNILLLPEYATPEKMANRLLTAIENAEGFGLQ